MKIELSLKFETPQKDGITVKERIIRFFEKGVDRKNAENLYDAACENGHTGGTNVFDRSIEIICEGLGLDHLELERQINQQNNSVSN